MVKTSALEKELGYGGKMDKKGQVTIFIIIGIVILIVFGLIFGLRSILSKGNEEIILENNPTIKAYVEQCLDEVSKDAIYLLGERGGYIYGDEELDYDNEIEIAYHFFEGKDVTPSLRNMENHISDYVGLNLEYCLDDFASFKEINMEIETGKMNIITRIGIDDVNIILEYPLTILYEGKRNKINEFTTQVPIRLGHIHSIIKLITIKEIENPERIDLEYLTNFDVDIDIRFLGNHNVLYRIEDLESSEVTRGPFIFNTLSKFAE